MRSSSPPATASSPRRRRPQGGARTALCPGRLRSGRALLSRQACRWRQAPHLEERPQRDVSPRAQLVAALERETGEGWADLPTATYDDVRIMVVRDLMIATADSLRDKTSEQLEPAALGSLNALRDQLHAWATDAGVPLSLDALRRQVDSLSPKRTRSPRRSRRAVPLRRLPNMPRLMRTTASCQPLRRSSRTDSGSCESPRCGRRLLFGSRKPGGNRGRPRTPKG